MAGGACHVDVMCVVWSEAGNHCCLQNTCAQGIVTQACGTYSSSCVVLMQLQSLQRPTILAQLSRAKYGLAREVHGHSFGIRMHQGGVTVVRLH